MNLLTRGTIAYLGLTLAFCVVTFEMERNGFNHPDNPAWYLNLGLRNGFLGIGGLVALIFGIEAIVRARMDKRDRRRQVEAAEKEKTEAARLRELYRLEEEKREREREAAGRAAEAQAEAERRQRVIAERLRRKQRTADEAARQAFEDFL